MSRNITHHENIFPNQPISPPLTWNYYIDYVTTNELTTHIVIDDHVTNTNHSHNDQDNSTDTLTTSENSPQIFNRPFIQKHTPSYLSNYVCNASSNNSESSTSGSIF